MSRGVRWLLSSLLLDLIGVRLLAWFGGVRLKFGRGLLTGLLPLIGLLGREITCGPVLARFLSSELPAGNGVSILSLLICLPNISSQVIWLISSSGPSRFSTTKKELLWLVGVWSLEIPMVI